MARSPLVVLVTGLAFALTLAVDPAVAGPTAADRAPAEWTPAAAAPSTESPGYRYRVGTPIRVPADALVDLDPALDRAYVVTQSVVDDPDELVVRIQVAGVDVSSRRVLFRTSWTMNSGANSTAVDTVTHKLFVGFLRVGVSELDGRTGQLLSEDVSGDAGQVDFLAADSGTGAAYAATSRVGAESVVGLDVPGGEGRPNGAGFRSIAPDGRHGRVLVASRQGLESFDSRTFARVDARATDYALFPAGVDTWTGSAYALDDAGLVRLDTSTGLETATVPLTGQDTASTASVDPERATVYLTRAQDVLVLDEASLRPVATVPLSGRPLLDAVHHVLYLRDGDTVTPVTQEAVGRPPAGVSVAVGADQTQDGGLAFAVRPRVRVTGADGRPVVGAAVRFGVPAGRASFRTADGSATAVTVPTAADGSATAPVLSAGRTTGRLTVTASVAGLGSVSLPERVQPSPVVSLGTTAPLQQVQTAAVGNRFARPVTVVVRDLFGTVAGRPVGFGIRGPATFVGGARSAVVRGAADGTATSPPVLAGSTPGAVTVDAGVADDLPTGPDSRPTAAVPLGVTAAGSTGPDLRVEVTGVPATARLGDSFEVPVRVTNVGTAPAPAGVLVVSTTDRLGIEYPEPGAYDDLGLPADRSEGQLAHVARVDLPAGLGPDESTLVTLDIDAARTGATALVARAVAGASDRDLADNTAVAPVAVS